MSGKRVILGVCGSIASYKAVVLLRLLKREGMEVQVVFTPAAHEFITPLSFSTLSGRVVCSAFSSANTWHDHVALANWADLLLIAPLTANTLAKLSQGLCDNLLLAIYLSAKCPVMVAPAMDVDMYHHASTQKNLAVLRTRGQEVLASPEGSLASGLEGAGRLMEPSDILHRVQRHFTFSARFVGKKVLITAGSTWEKVDDVRFITNASSGKMGYAVASAFAHGGAEVILVSGPTHLVPRHPRIRVCSVESAQDMYEACLEQHKGCDIAVFVAAVGDFRVNPPIAGKIKKMREHLITLSLEENIDIAKALGEQKDRRFHVGFALETTHDTVEAKRKLMEKNLDVIALNALCEPDAGFGTATNRVTLISSDGKQESLEVKLKEEVAYDIVDLVYRKTHATRLVDSK